jgi:hypothetical protein
MSGTSPAAVLTAGESTQRRDNAPEAMDSRPSGKLPPLRELPPEAADGGADPADAAPVSPASGLLFHHPDSQHDATMPGAAAEVPRRPAAAVPRLRRTTRAAHGHARTRAARRRRGLGTRICRSSAVHAERGHLRVPRGYVDQGLRIDSWLYFQRRARKKGTVADDKVRRLEAIGIVWAPVDEAWERGLAAAQEFHAEHGHLQVPKGYVNHDLRLEVWICTQRRARKKGTLPGDKVRRLEAIGIVWAPVNEAWEQGLAAAHHFRAEHGHLRVPAEHVSHGVKLRQWLITQRYWHKRGKVPADRIERLEAIGVIQRPD